MAKDTSKVIAGAVAGIALGVAAGLFLQSKKGKKMRKDAENYVADFYKYISPKLKKIEKMGKEEYQEFMDGALEQYAKAKKISGPMIKELKATVQKSWSHFAK
jgi:gas vesicle protein